MKAKRWLWTLAVALPLAAAGLTVAHAAAQRKHEPARPTGYICPLTGEELPCPDCCPLKKK